MLIIYNPHKGELSVIQPSSVHMFLPCLSNLPAGWDCQMRWERKMMGFTSCKHPHQCVASIALVSPARRSMALCAWAVLNMQDSISHHHISLASYLQNRCFVSMKCVGFLLLIHLNDSRGEEKNMEIRNYCNHVALSGERIWPSVMFSPRLRQGGRCWMKQRRWAQWKEPLEGSSRGSIEQIKTQCRLGFT